MGLPNYVVRQLARPAGLPGRLVMWLLNNVNRDMNASTMRALEVRNNDRILEVGFGGGTLLDLALSQNPDLVAGVEISDLALNDASKRFAKAIKSGRLMLAKVENGRIPFPSGSFSKVCCVNVVYFWDDISVAASEVNRVLHDNGCFVVCYEGSGPNNRKTSPDHIEHCLVRAGFQVLSTHRELDRRNGEYFWTKARKLPLRTEI